MPADCLDEILVDLAGMDLAKMDRSLVYRWLCATCELVQAVPAKSPARARWIGLLANRFLLAFPEQAKRGHEALRQDLAACVTRAAQDWQAWKTAHAPAPETVKRTVNS